MITENPICSIVIPSLGRPTYVYDCLRDLALIADASFEVIIVEQGNPEIDIVGSFSGVTIRHFFLKVPSASLARNIGLREARGDVVLFLDDDIRILNPRFLRNHLRHYDSPGVSGVYGQVLEVGEDPTDKPEPEQIESDWGWMKLPANYSRSCRTRNGASNNLSVRRDWAIAVGGMDAWFEKGARREETEFNLRYTKRYGLLVFDPEAGLTHLSAGGGSRTWGRVHVSVPMHHIVGQWYFFLRAMLGATLGIRGLLMEFRYILIALLKNPQAGLSPLIFIRNVGRAVYGLGVAISRLVRGPRLINTVNPTLYYEILPESVST